MLNVMLLVEGAYSSRGHPRRRGADQLVHRANEITYNWPSRSSSSSWRHVRIMLAASNPERAELTTWNTRQVWKLYRGNWQA